MTFRDLHGTLERLWIFIVKNDINVHFVKILYDFLCGLIKYACESFGNDVSPSIEFETHKKTFCLFMVNHYFSRYKVSEMSRRNTLLTKQRKNVYKFERLNIPLFTIWLHFNYICIRTKLQPFFLFSNCLLQSLLFVAYKRARPITKTSVEFIRLRNSSFDST